MSNIWWDLRGTLIGHHCPVEPSGIIKILRELEAASPDALRQLDHELLLSIKMTLLKHKREIDNTLLRLAFTDEQQLN